MFHQTATGDEGISDVALLLVLENPHNGYGAKLSKNLLKTALSGQKSLLVNGREANRGTNHAAGLMPSSLSWREGKQGENHGRTTGVGGASWCGLERA